MNEHDYDSLPVLFTFYLNICYGETDYDSMYD